jgi:ABC-2 type transport system permease protein
MVFGYVIVALLMEVIFRMDIKGIFKHKKQFIFNAACVALIFVIFRYDVLGYNTYVPNDSELQSCAVSLGIFDGVVYGVLDDGTSYSYSSGNYAFDYMELKGNPSVTELARRICTNDVHEEKNYYSAMIYFGYNFTNGKKCYRQYYVDTNDEETMKLIADVFNDSNYKAGSAPVLKYGRLSDYDLLTCWGKYNHGTIELTPELQAKILDAYEKDYNNLDFDTVLNTYPLGIIYMSQSDHEGNAYSYARRDSYSGALVIYPTYTNTIKLLQDNGFDMTLEVTADDIKAVRVSYYEVYNKSDNYKSAKTILSEVPITDKDKINTILANIENPNVDWYIDNYTDFLESNDDNYYDLWIDYYDSSISDYQSNVYEFRKGCVPEFMEELGE